MNEDIEYNEDAVRCISTSDVDAAYDKFLEYISNQSGEELENCKALIERFKIPLKVVR